MYTIPASDISCAPGQTTRSSLIAGSSTILRGTSLPDVADEDFAALDRDPLIVLQGFEFASHDLIQVPVGVHADFLLKFGHDPATPVDGFRLRIHGHSDIRTGLGMYRAVFCTLF